MTKILLVEDDKSLREIYGVRLLAEGYQIISAGDGEQALAMAVKERPDLIISDVMMPKISGFDMLDILRSTPETKDLKVIMMTALSSEDQRSRGEALGANRYLVKSQVGIEDVVRTVHDVLADSPITSAPAAQIFGTPPLSAATKPSQPTQPSTPINQSTPSTPNIVAIPLQPISPVQQPTPAPIQPVVTIQQPAIASVQPTISAEQPTVAPISNQTPTFQPTPTQATPTQATPTQATPTNPMQNSITANSIAQSQQAPEPYISPEQQAVLGDKVVTPIVQPERIDFSALINQELNSSSTTSDNQSPANPNSQI